MEEKKEPTIITDMKKAVVIIPDCCKEGRDDCPHMVRKPTVSRKNPGL